MLSILIFAFTIFILIVFKISQSDAFAFNLCFSS